MQLQQWIEEQTLHKYLVLQTELVASCNTVKQLAIGGLDDYSALLDQLEEWWSTGKQGLTISANITVSVLTQPAAIQTNTTPAQGRASATSIQLANASQVRTTTENSGNFAISLTERWPCRNNYCRNNGNTCWIDGRDEAQHRYPSYGEILHAWSRGVAEGEMSIEAPSAALTVRLIKLKARGDLTTTPRQKRLGYNNGLEEVSGNVFYIGCLPESKKRRAVSSSPPLISSSQQSYDDNSELTVISFIDWCRTRPEWGSRRAEQLDKIQEMAIEEDYDIHGLIEVDAREWEERGLLRGYLARLRRSAKKWSR